MSEKLATIRATSGAIKKLIQQAALSKNEEYQHVMLTIIDGELNVLSSGTGKSLSYATFREGSSFFDIDVEEAVIERTSEDETPLAEALIDVDMFLKYFELVEAPDQTIRLEFHGEPTDRLASFVEMYGELNAKLHLPVNERILEKAALGAPQKFDADNVWDGEVRFDTHIRTNVSKIQRIIDAVDADDITNIDNYPIVVKDGKFVLDATDGNRRNRIFGDLLDDNTEVTGDDVANLYGSAFEEIFDVLDGEVWLQTAPDGAPLAIVKEDADGVIRHVIGGCGTL